MTRDALAETREWLSDLEHRRAYGAEIIKLDLATALADARTSGEISQRELAELTRVSQAYIAKLESGKANPTIGHIGEILAAMFLRIRFRHEPLLPKPAPSPTASSQPDDDQVIERRLDDPASALSGYRSPLVSVTVASSTAFR